MHVGDGRGAHVLPPKALRGSCFVIQPFDEMVATLDPQLIEARRPPADLAGHLAAGVVDQHRVGPAFSYNDLLLLASVADTSDRPAKAIEPIGEYPRGQDDREAILGAHFDLAGPEAIPCSGLVVRSLPDEVSRALPRARRHVPDAWQQAVRPGEPLDEDVRRLVARIPEDHPRLHRRRGYAPIIAALDEYAVASGLDDLQTPHLRVALTVMRHLAADHDRRTPLDLRRLGRIITEVLATDRGGRLARLTTPGDLARSTDHFRPTGLTWSASLVPAE